MVVKRGYKRGSTNNQKLTLLQISLISSFNQNKYNYTLIKFKK